MKCWKGRFSIRSIFLGWISIFYFRTTLYQLLATSLNSGRCGLFLNGRTRWLSIPHWQICMIIWNICLRWEFYIWKLSFWNSHYLVWFELKLKPYWTGIPVVFSKASYESWVQQLTPFNPWTLTVGILLSKVLFFSNKRTRLYFKLYISFFKRIKMLDVEIQVL